MNEKIRILVADNHSIIRRLLVDVIKSEPNFEIVGEAETGEITLEKTKMLCPEILVMDIDLPIFDGFEVAKIINDKHHRVKIILLCDNNIPENFKLFSTLGLSGFILKDKFVLEIIECLNEVSNGMNFISPLINEIVTPTEEFSTNQTTIT